MYMYVCIISYKLNHLKLYFVIDSFKITTAIGCRSLSIARAYGCWLEVNLSFMKMFASL